MTNVRTSLLIDDDLRNRTRLASMRANMSMGEFIRGSLEASIERLAAADPQLRRLLDAMDERRFNG